MVNTVESLRALEKEEQIQSVRVPVRQREEGEKLKLDDLLEPENVRKMRAYIGIRASIGKGEDKLTDEEVRDKYMSRMRDFETSDKGILDESTFIYRVKNDDDKARIAKEAYELYEQVGNVFVNGSTWDAITGVGEHITNIVDPSQSPSTYLGLGVGKVASILTGKVVAQGAKEVVKYSAGQGVKETVKQVATKAAVNPATILGSKLFQKNAVVSGVATAATVDAFSASYLHDMYQDANIHIGVQDEYSKWATGFAALGGVIGGGVDLLSRAKLPSALAGYNKNSSKAIQEAGTYKDYYKAEPKVKKKINDKIIETTRTWTKKVLDGKLVVDNFDDFADGTSLQVDLLRTLFLGNSDLDIKGIGQILREEGLSLNLNFKSKDKRITDLLTDFIESIDEDTAKNMIKALETPDKDGRKINLFQQLNIDVKGMSFQEKLSSLIAVNTSEAGQKLNIFSQVARDLKNAKKQGSKVYLQTLAEEEANLNKINGVKLNKDGTPVKSGKSFKNYDAKGNVIETATSTQGFRHFQSVWKRTVVSALSTTVLNLKGLAGVTVIKTSGDLAEVALRMSISAPVAAYKLMKGDKNGAMSEFYKSAVIMKNQQQRLRNLLDPNATKEMFEALMIVDEDSAISLNRFLASGVEAGDNLEEVAKRYNFRNKEEIILRRDKKGKVILKDKFGNPTTAKKEKIQRIGTDSKWLRFTEGYVDAAQKVMLVKTADTFMKSQAYMGNLDRLLRSKAGDKYNSVIKLSNLNQEDMHKFLRSEDFLNLSAEATEQTLEDILSKSYRNPRGAEVTSKTRIGSAVEKAGLTIGNIAGVIENIGNIPVIGTLMPFGRFFNNSIALTYDMAGGGITNHIFDMAKAGSLKDAGTIALKPSEKTVQKLKRGAVAGFGTGVVASRTEEGDDGPVQEFFEDVIRGAANYSLLGAAMASDKKKIEMGLKWTDHLDSTGDLTNIIYDFPASQFFILARYLNLKQEGREIPQDLRLQMSEQFLYGQISRNLGKLNGINTIAAQAMDGEWSKVGETAATTVFVPLSTSVSGFLRPLDAVNRLAAYPLGNDAEAMDARQSNIMEGNTPTKVALNRLLYDSTRYVNNIFEFLTGNQTAKSKRMASKEGDITPQSPVGDVLGFRKDAPRTFTEVLLAEIGVEGWRVEQRMKTSFPEGDALYKEKIQPQLEYEAQYLYKSREYKNASPKQKDILIKQMLSRVKSRVKRQMEGNALNKDTQTNKTGSFAAIRNIYKTSTKHRKQAIKHITGKNDMSVEELKTLGETSRGLVILGQINRLIKQLKKGEEI